MATSEISTAFQSAPKQQQEQSSRNHFCSPRSANTTSSAAHSTHLESHQSQSSSLDPGRPSNGKKMRTNNQDNNNNSKTNHKCAMMGMMTIRQDDTMTDHLQRIYEEHLQLARNFVQWELEFAASNKNEHQQPNPQHHQQQTQPPAIFQLLRPALIHDPYLALAGLETGVYKMTDLPAALQSNTHFCLQVVARYSSLFQWSWQQPLTGEEYQQQDYSFPQSLDWNTLPPHLHHDVNLARWALRRRPELWGMLPPNLQHNLRVTEAIRVNGDRFAVTIVSSSSHAGLSSDLPIQRRMRHRLLTAKCWYHPSITTTTTIRQNKRRRAVEPNSDSEGFLASDEDHSNSTSSEDNDNIYNSRDDNDDDCSSVCKLEPGKVNIRLPTQQQPT